MAGTSHSVAKIAVSAATYWIDRPYDYLVPEELADKAVPGARVYVPFARGNRRSEGVILAMSDHSEYRQLKPIIAVLDEEPLLTEEQIRLALFMRDRFFCTVYDAVKTILPAGVWFREDGSRRVRDKTVEMARLAMPREDAAALSEAKRRRSPKQAEMLELLCSFEALPTRDLLHFTGAARQSLTLLCKSGAVELYAREVYRRPEIREAEPQPLPILNDEQQKAFSGLKELALADKAGAALLFGVTGSGKTSVYIHLIQEQLLRVGGAILLGP